MLSDFGHIFGLAGTLNFWNCRKTKKVQRSGIKYPNVKSRNQTTYKL